MVADVSVSVPAMLSVSEGDGNVEVCVSLSALSDTERDFIVTLTSSNDTGTRNFAHRILSLTHPHFQQ